MLRVEKNTVQADYLREFKGSESFGLQISRNDHPLTIYNAYSVIAGAATYLNAHKLGYQNRIELTYSIDVDCISYVNGQYIIDPTKYFDNATPENILPDGNYFFEFSNGVEPFNSECFIIVAQRESGNYTQPTIKAFQNDVLFIFND